ncbi:type II toxin-antitoxin system prevent-host-death family antitoxin [Planococcus sp. 11815]|uniref:type II toxin-antitoxin system prevent-host-death family antitoxin n=1 Tax=Planococcus sp. 11815 TaxID=2939413 RepID=UPI003DA43BF4
MLPESGQKPSITSDQTIPVSKASKNFSYLCKAAKDKPQYISVHGRIDSVMLDYREYERLYQELEYYKELFWKFEISNRISELHATPEKLVSLREAIGEQAYARILAMDPDEIADNELFDVE